MGTGEFGCSVCSFTSDTDEAMFEHLEEEHGIPMPLERRQLTRLRMKRGRPIFGEFQGELREHERAEKIWLASVGKLDNQ